MTMLQTALPALFAAFPKLSIVGELRENPSLMAQQPLNMPVRPE
jgi:hypothetical protein